ncbi:phage integrase family protein [Pseudonocardia sp. Ae168_Ps1]|uniref:tyrosine-type recombinase/integrase n=1 Tax=unclassified Pseudonocardia TaxID=2619320 RepID=UPI00094AD73E|nr:MULTISPECIES: site-specific integrase [unclassified Pseudonocardia]OLL75088.1 phage integrase family protein [Pseudonocardia sp. Ae150A_Ps1]OLL81083.1 phage integrase family protein [Pseudonocardia sp. Ae168_Ps1]OLL84802.1 phage integrase family protein [Pseudonocardia sp. Ae263_Ps1]OLL95181.1 phage integrase family protein [Pseudonocardia sp. Ae356_Ps1]
MGHVQDRWYRPEVDPTTKKVRKVKTSIHGKGQRYKVRYIDPDGVERSRTFPDRCKKEADDFLVEVESAKREGKYVSVNAGKISFKAHAENWLKGQSTDRATRGALRSRLDARIYPFFEKRPLNSITPAIVRNWLGELDDRGYSANYRTVLFTIVSSVLDSAVEERLIAHNPCKAQTIKRPTSSASNIVIWPRTRLAAIEQHISERFRLAVIIGAGCGLRQGEILGLGTEDIDRDSMVVYVRRQIRTVERRIVFALPKGGKTRVVPLSGAVLDHITAHLDDFPPSSITLPWDNPDGEPVTTDLLMTGDEGRLYSGDLFNKVIWQGAFRSAGLVYRKRADGMHALRHFFASTLLSQGVSVKELAAYLGHSDPGFTLRTYTHLVPSSYERARAGIDGVLGPSPSSSNGLHTA